MSVGDVLSYWPVAVGILAVIAAVVIGVVVFCRMPPKQQKEMIIQWLLQAVVKAEKELGGGTGKVKLSVVYDEFKKVFPVISTFLPFAKFSAFVDEALESMRDMLSSNVNVAEYVNGGELAKD